jgi:hypothetical protein
MAAAKAQRWYEIDGETLYVYDAPSPAQSVSISIVGVSDLPYYRSRFRLQRVWAGEGALDGSEAA